ncbi:hypothetical protein SBDP1_520013 [Syntrophobacter sp. SbD1]|nr:hypothetical protein SBDP1_520013 [Syntrophobacter sp. SbD1]
MHKINLNLNTCGGKGNIAESVVPPSSREPGKDLDRINRIYRIEIINLQLLTCCASYVL